MVNSRLAPWALFLIVASLFFSACKRVERLAPTGEVRYLNSKFGCITNDWEFEFQGKWYPATVPGNIHDDLLHNHLIPDPHYGTNEDSVQWVADSVWTYRLYFDKDCAGSRAFDHRQLVFEGLDTYAEIILNGQKLTATDGTTRPDNMFRRWTFDLPDNLQDKHNELIVKFYPSVPIERAASESLPYQLPDARVFSRKAQYESGWDWGPKLITCGIWKNVYLRSYSDYRVEDVYVRDTKPTTDSAGTWGTTVEVNVLSDKEIKATLLVEVSDADGANITAKQKVRLKPGRNEFAVQVDIPQPKLWWPNGMGEPHLYYYTVRLEDRAHRYECAPVGHGLRTVTLKREKDAIGESFAFEVNGKPCFMRGANWIPASSYPGTMARPEGNDLYYQLLHDCQAVNMNMVRVWGGGFYEDEAFYNYCDQFGLLVWQDFMYACNPYPGDETFLKNAQQEAVEQVTRLRNHPCIAIWCGNNEVHNGLEDWGWQTSLQWSDEVNAQLFADFHQLFEEMLPKTVEKLQQGGNYVSSSPTYGWGHEECTTHGCSHYWGVWWGELPFSVWPEKTGRFMTEYGFQSYPEYALWEKYVPENELRLGSPSLNNHQKHGRGVEIIRKAMQEMGYTRTDDLAEFALVSQWVQAEGIVQAIDAHRIDRDRCRGTLYWQLNDCWPVASWSSIDCTGRWKLLHHRLKDAYANVALAVRHVNDTTMELFVVNDSLAEVTCRVDWRLLSAVHPPELMETGSKTVTVPSDGAVKVATLHRGRYYDLIEADLIQNGAVIATKTSFFVMPRHEWVVTSSVSPRN